MSYMNVPTSKLTNDELRRIPVDDLINRLRKCDQERAKAIQDHSRLVKEINQQLQSHLVEIRNLKAVNSRLQEDNQELRDLCCFLDDERQRAQKLAKEWEKFGKYTSSVMRGDVGAYQEKLKALEVRQQELLKENLELKQLCVYLEEQRLQLCKETSADRDQGDGSSNSSSTCADRPSPNSLSSSLLPPPLLTNRPPSDGRKSIQNKEETTQYVRQLEEKIQQLEEEKKLMANSNHGNCNSYSNQTNESRGHVPSRSRAMSPSRADTHKFFSSPDNSYITVKPKPPSLNRSRSPERRLPRTPENQKPWNVSNSPESITLSPKSPTKPEAMVQAMKVLEIHQQLEKPCVELGAQEDLDETQKAFVREMCNVVWRKLGDTVPEYKTQI